jgi:Tfp pilus assembly protein PilF
MLTVKGVRIHSWGIGIGATLALAALVPLAVVACGGGERSSSLVVEEVRVVDQPPNITLPPSTPEARVVLASETREDVLAGPEPAREVTYEEAESAFLEKRYGEAVDLFTSYSGRRSQNPWGYYMLGLSAWKAGEHEVAEAAFERALELDPGHEKSLVNLSRVLLNAGRPEDALVKVESVLELDPESNVGLRLRARAYHELGRPDEAIDSYRQAILADDSDAWSMNNMGFILVQQDRFDEALPPLARAVELRDDVALFQNNLGIALERTGYFRAAEATYRSALALEDAYEKAQVNLARVEVLEEPADLEPVDLGVLAQNFLDEIEGWRESVAYRDEVIDVFQISEPDSLKQVESDGSAGGTSK